MKKGLITPQAFQKWQGGHPWLRADDILHPKNLPHRPSAIFFGENWWLCSPKSFLRLRRFGPPQPQWMKNPRTESITNADQFRSYFGEWLVQHLTETLEKKIRAVLKPNDDIVLRWIFSEADWLPGLTVDIFKNTLVCQITTAPIEAFWPALRELLETAFAERFGYTPHIFELRNSPVRKKEGLEIITPTSDKIVELSPLRPHPLRWNGYMWHFQLYPPTQKTGAYLDQRDNHTRAAEVAKTRGLKTAWDICCYQGGFTLPLLDQGLTVTAVDQSQDALETLKKNIKINALPEPPCNIVKADAFKWLHEQRARSQTVDLIILDPPSFVKSRESLPAARKGYIELNRLALECLTPQGVLVSCVCSHHMRPDDYRKVLEAAAAPNKIQILERHGPSADHPVLPAFPEGDYLHAWFAQRVVDSEQMNCQMS